MGADSKIGWTDHTFNPWYGCAKVSPGCANCYAETLMDTRYHKVRWGNGQPRKRTSAANWKEPLKWNKMAVCADCGEFFTFAAIAGNLGKCPNCHHNTMRRPRVFCASLSDWLDDEAPIEWLVDLLVLIFETRNLDWLLLTKRPQNWGDRLHQALRAAKDPGLVFEGWLSQWLDGDYPGNVWIGATVEDQQRADERIPELLRIPATVRFLSCEPLMGEVDLFAACFNPGSEEEPIHFGKNHHCLRFGVDWVICGGESGPGARPMHPDWARSLRDQCAAAGVPFFFKQWGEWVPTGSDDFDWKAKRLFLESNGKDSTDWDVSRHTAQTANMQSVGKKRAGRLLDGREHDDFPAEVSQ